jgi:hypothetical protein
VPRRFSDACLLARVDGFVIQASENLHNTMKTCTIAEMAALSIEPLAQVCLLHPGVETL